MFASSGWRRLTRLVLSVDGGMGTTSGLQYNVEEVEITEQEVTGKLQLSELMSVCDISGYFLHGQRQGMFWSPHPSAHDLNVRYIKTHCVSLFPSLLI